ncbi:UDP-glucose 4-epimerase [Stella humosa]|uniref:UDP-glucose 4-epimerase n=1 Tax=Stella humosa TaxID=94 RepID=A0A3N1KY95_9PROT|nr:NAD(P)-dependent oxidoreductase [Stella humosa]ROP83580.1 UDP-glucose 4-epimerase [Stella humosa]BBK33148.1 NAD-dependent epimerase [Stella humosa]
MTDGPILVTGIGGLIGAAVLRRFVADGLPVVAMDRAPPPGLDLDRMGVPFLPHDLPDPQRWHEAIVRFGVRRVVHAGSISGPMLLGDNPARICDINLGGLMGLLDAARTHRLGRIVWFSSIMAYGERGDLVPVSEDTPLRPHTVYGATKAAGEALVHAYHAEQGVDAVALRVASCYGPGRTTACLIRTLVEDGLAGRPTPVHPAPGRSRQHIFVGDVVTAIRAALDTPSLPRRAYNIGPGRTQTIEEIVAEVGQAVPGVRLALDPQGLAWNTFGLGALSIDAASRDLGFAPSTSIAAGAVATRDWVQQRGAA